MLADASARSSSAQEPFRASLNQSSASKPQTPTASPSPRRPVAPPQAKTTPATPRLLTSPPRKNTIRLVENDQNNRREKYDGSRWRLVCVGNDNECTNLAYARGLCGKHYTQQRSTEPPPAKKRKLLVHHFSVPTMGNQARHARTNTFADIRRNPTNSNQTNATNDDDDIEIVQVLSKPPPARRTTCTTIKPEFSDFNIFSVDYNDDPPAVQPVKEEPRKPPTPTEDVQFLATKVTTSNGLNIAEMIAKKLPPLTDFEEDYLATRMIERLPISSLMVDAQLYLHHEAIDVVKKNYRLKMDTIAPEYFYDFLLRHPRVAIRFDRWFMRCKPLPPTTGCPIDIKVWTLAMMVRGVSGTDSMIDECEG